MDGKPIIDITLQKKYLRQAYEKALESRDTSTQNGAILIDRNGEIIASAANNFPEGVKETTERWQRPLKYKIVEHSERAAIYEAAKRGRSTDGATMVCCWSACTDCARAIINSGIKTLVTHKQAADRSPPFWSEEIAIALQLFQESGVNVVYYDGEVGIEKEVLHSGDLWKP